MWAASESEITDFVESQTVEVYRTHDKWGKCFREGGLLEWYNRPFDGTAQGIYRITVSSIDEIDGSITRVYGAAP